MESNFILEDSIQQYLKEDYLHFFWKSKKLIRYNLFTSNNEKIEILDFGQHNLGDGPDFLNCKIKIGDVTWVGNVEIHINSKDWFYHHHQNDDNFNNIILHVVYSHNSSKNFDFPTLELKNQIESSSILKMIDFFQHKNEILCGTNISKIDITKINIFKESLIIERLKEKSEKIKIYLAQENNDWQNLIYYSLFLAFGMKHNEKSMEELYQSIPKKALREIITNKNHFQCEALFLGQSGFFSQLEMLEEKPSYFINLENEYDYLKTKYQLTPITIVWRCKSIRPLNSPVLRVVQLANLLTSGLLNFDLLEEVLLNDSLLNYYQNNIWDNYYNLSKKAKKFNSSLSINFLNHLRINLILPLVFLKQQFFQQNFEESLLNVLDNIKAEQNSIIKMFSDLGLKSKTAFDSQALLQLKKEYCNQKKCLSCQVGVNLLI